MKRKTKIIVTATAMAITSLMINAYQIDPTISPTVPQIAPVSEGVTEGRTYTPLTVTEPIVAEETTEISAQNEHIYKVVTEPQNTEPIPTEIVPTQPTEKEKTVTAPIPTTQTATKPTTPPAPISTEPKNGDTRIVNGKQQGYLLGFGWVDYMGENEVIYCDDMYENGNKVGIMD